MQMSATHVFCKGIFTFTGLVAKHYVYDRVTEQSQAFTRGLWDVIDRDWLRIFSEPELQVLIRYVIHFRHACVV